MALIPLCRHIRSSILMSFWHILSLSFHCQSLHIMIYEYPHLCITLHIVYSTLIHSLILKIYIITPIKKLTHTYRFDLCILRFNIFCLLTFGLCIFDFFALNFGLSIIGLQFDVYQRDEFQPVVLPLTVFPI